MESEREREQVSDLRFSHCPPPHPLINDQSLILVNFEDLVLLSLSEIKRELCKLMISISQGIDLYKVLVVGKNGKLNETIEGLQIQDLGKREPRSALATILL